MTTIFERADVKFLRMALLNQIHESNGQPITINALADSLECGYCTVLRHREALAKQGLIQWDKRQGKDTGGSVYTVSEEGTTIIRKFYNNSIALPPAQVL